MFPKNEKKNLAIVNRQIRLGLAAGAVKYCQIIVHKWETVNLQKKKNKKDLHDLQSSSSSSKRSKAERNYVISFFFRLKDKILIMMYKMNREICK